MKQQYRHTKPIRGKDPTLQKKEIETGAEIKLIEILPLVTLTVKMKTMKINRKLKKTFK